MFGVSCSLYNFSKLLYMYSSTGRFTKHANHNFFFQYIIIISRYSNSDLRYVQCVIKKTKIRTASLSVTGNRSHRRPCSTWWYNSSFSTGSSRSMYWSRNRCFLNRNIWLCFRIGLDVFAVPVLAFLYLSHFDMTSASFSSATKLRSEFPNTS